MARQVGRAAVGLLVGLLNGLLGAGATLLVPALHYVLHESRPTAHSTALPLILMASSVSLGVYVSHGRLPLEPGLLVAAGSAAGGVGGAWLLRYVPPARLRQMFGAAMMAAALRMLWG